MPGTSFSGVADIRTPIVVTSRIVQVLVVRTGGNSGTMPAIQRAATIATNPQPMSVRTSLKWTSCVFFSTALDAWMK